MKKERISGKIVIQISIVWAFVFAIIVALLIAFFKSSIFAKNNENKELEVAVAIEENSKAVNILELLIENNYSNKKLVNEERDIEFEVEKQETDKLPDGEEKIEQQGEIGKKQVTVVKTYENENLVSEEIVDSVITKEPIKEIVYVGTSKFLSQYSVHIGEEMYLIESGDLKEMADENSNTITQIKRYLNVTLLEASGEWAKIKYNENEGYIQALKLTSEKVTPKISEKNRIAKLQNDLKFDMDLNKVSGLTVNDYKTIFKYNASDKNNIFSENAEIFYNMEQKYGINGIFVAAIGIHESAWGTSYLAKEKYNLFGYKAYDRDPINSAQTFENYEDAIETITKALKENYLTENAVFYNGTTIESVNKKYASDEEWAKKIYAYMEYLYDKLG